jgi:peptidylprolyl isomerase domain and WD repeat-containing protein 1
MHREDLSHIVVSKTNFIITASVDGVLMFWTKTAEGGIEFVKTFRSHLKPINSMVASADGQLLATASEDQTVKFYDIVNFDMFLMLKLDFTPSQCEWLHQVGAPEPIIAVADANGLVVSLFLFSDSGFCSKNGGGAPALPQYAHRTSLRMHVSFVC